MQSVKQIQARVICVDSGKLATGMIENAKPTNINDIELQFKTLILLRKRFGEPMADVRMLGDPYEIVFVRGDLPVERNAVFYESVGLPGKHELDVLSRTRVDLAVMVSGGLTAPLSMVSYLQECNSGMGVIFSDINPLQIWYGIMLIQGYNRAFSKSRSLSRNLPEIRLPSGRERPQKLLIEFRHESIETTAREINERRTCFFDTSSVFAVPGLAGGSRWGSVIDGYEFLKIVRDNDNIKEGSFVLFSKAQYNSYAILMKKKGGFRLYDAQWLVDHESSTHNVEMLEKYIDSINNPPMLTEIIREEPWLLKGNRRDGGLIA